MTRDAAFHVRYWGVRGSTPSPLSADAIDNKVVDSVYHMMETGLLDEVLRNRPTRDELASAVCAGVPFHLRSTYGGNTTCIEVQTQDELIILDCGSGIRDLGVDLNQRWNKPDYQGSREAYVLVTHSHIDHTSGLPFFDPFYDPRNAFTILAPQSVVDGLEDVLDPRGSLSGVYIAPDLDIMRGIRELRAIDIGESFQIGDTCVANYSLNHPGGCVAYRLDRNHRSIVFASDHEHCATPDRDLADFARDTDLLYMDAQYYDDEYQGRASLPGDTAHSKSGWGHSSVEAAIATAVCAGARCLHLGHHDPKRADKDIYAFDKYAQSIAEESLGGADERARQMRVDTVHEGLSIDIYT